MRSKPLHLFILSSLAFAQPIFSALYKQATFFVAHGSGAREILCLVLILSVLIPVLFFAIELAAGLLNAKFRDAIHSLFVFVFLALIFLPLLKNLDVPDFVIIFAAAFSAILFVILLHRWRTASLFLTYLSPAVVLIPAFFLFQPQIRSFFSRSGPDGFTVGPISNKPPIVFLILDELPLSSLLDENRRIDAVRYPGFARLAAQSIWFRNASAVSGMTNTAVPAILTGKFPIETAAPTLRQYPANIFTFLSSQYKIRALETATSLAPEAPDAPGKSITKKMRSILSDLSAVYLHIILPESISKSLPSVTDTWNDFWVTDRAAASSEDAFPKEDRIELFNFFLDSIDAPVNSQFYFLHLMLPHRPWKYLPSGAEYYQQAPGSWGMHGGRGTGKARWTDDPWLTVQGYQRHLLQLAFLDKLLGRLLDRLQQTKLSDNALIVVTADHGASFWPDSWLRIPTSSNYWDILSVPLFIKLPGQKEGRISDENVQLIDIVPTIADILHATLPVSVDGKSALQNREAAPVKRISVSGKVQEYPANMQRDPTLDRKIALFGTKTPAEDLYRIRPDDSLFGKSLSELNIVAAKITFQLYKPELYRNMSLTAGIFPAMIAGELLSGFPLPKQRIAVVVNGTVRAVTETSLESFNFTAMVSEHSFHAGKNDIELLLLPDKPGEPLLLVKEQAR